MAEGEEVGTAAEVGLEKVRFQFDKLKNSFQKTWADTHITPGWNCNDTPSFFWDSGRICTTEFSR